MTKIPQAVWPVTEDDSYCQRTPIARYILTGVGHSGKGTLEKSPKKHTFSSRSYASWGYSHLVVSIGKFPPYTAPPLHDCWAPVPLLKERLGKSVMESCSWHLAHESAAFSTINTIPKAVFSFFNVTLYTLSTGESQKPQTPGWLSCVSVGVRV